MLLRGEQLACATFPLRCLAELAQYASGEMVRAQDVGEPTVLRTREHKTCQSQLANTSKPLHRSGVEQCESGAFAYPDDVVDWIPDNLEGTVGLHLADPTLCRQAGGRPHAPV